MGFKTVFSAGKSFNLNIVHLLLEVLIGDPLNLSSEPYFKVKNRSGCPQTGTGLWMNFSVRLQRFYLVGLKPGPLQLAICERRILSFWNSEVALCRTIARPMRRDVDTRGDT